MGWNEADDDDYVITEEDLEEFYNLTKQVFDLCNHAILSATLRKLIKRRKKKKKKMLQICNIFLWEGNREMVN